MYYNTIMIHFTKWSSLDQWCQFGQIQNNFKSSGTLQKVNVTVYISRTDKQIKYTTKPYILKTQQKRSIGVIQIDSMDHHVGNPPVQTEWVWTSNSQSLLEWWMQWTWQKKPATPDNFKQYLKTTIAENLRNGLLHSPIIATTPRNVSFRDTATPSTGTTQKQIG